MAPFPAAILDPDALDLPGRLLLGSAPGRPEYGSLGTVDLDLASLAADHGVAHVVCLVEGDELELLGIDDLPARTTAFGLGFHHVPIPDGSVPRDCEAMDAITGTILDLLRNGQRVYLHCWAGLGRTGTVATCCLVALGHPPWKALALVRRARPGAVETLRQETFIRDYTAWTSHA